MSLQHAQISTFPLPYLTIWLMPPGQKVSKVEEPTLVPEADDWNGPFCRIVCCSDDTERSMRPPNQFFLSAVTSLRFWTYTISGFVDFEEGSRMSRIGPGTVLAVPQPGRGSLIYRKNGLPWRRIYIGIEGAAAMEIFDHITQRFGHVHELPRQSEGIRAAREFCRLVAREPKRTPQFWSVEAFRWLNAWWASCHESVPTVQKLLDIEGGSSQLIGMSHGSVKEFAERMGYSRSYLSRRLKKIWNRNPSEVLREKRFEEARRLLRETRLPVAEVANKAGFGSSSSFCAAFKAKYRQTALQYRHETIWL